MSTIVFALSSASGDVTVVDTSFVFALSSTAGDVVVVSSTAQDTAVITSSQDSVIITGCTAGCRDVDVTAEIWEMILK